ncbi:pyrimidine 5'-nucleotidase [Algicella marina]|uniref:Pyrimidine 5'-nucleotidase n=1 Tax=Algicella marina TaxID=2683284 RepID=A0A6P1SX90_9RHOB|nr:pyrimidine 5'-nucleotidase [Algicella marina]QHQ35068.1 pyrimidine 5'-nucleotidase [Algicella marina]
MVKAAFDHVQDWVFDLDNTLYDPGADLFLQIESRMSGYIMDALAISEAEAAVLRDRYWRDHGTTLAGLMEEHGLEPDPFLEKVHDIDLSGLLPSPELRAAIAALPGRKIVYTNGSRRHAERVLEARGLGGVMDAYFGVEDAGYHPKPHGLAFERVFALAQLRCSAAAMFEDDPRNLAVPHGLGMKTVLVGPHQEHPHVHHSTEDLVDFLSRLV